jgi:hypothetical protein
VIFLSESIKKTIDIVDGYTVGNSVVENGKGYIQLNSGELIELQESDIIEVRSGDVYQRLELEVLINTKTNEGWPGFAGMYCRVKERT